MTAPTGLDQDGSPGAGDLCEMFRANVSSAVELGTHDDGWNLGQGIQWEFSQAQAFSETMKRRVHIGSGVADHVDTPNVKLGSGRVVLAGLFAAEEIAEQGSGKAGVGYESGLDDMAQVDQLHPYPSSIIVVLHKGWVFDEALHGTR